MKYRFNIPSISILFYLLSFTSYADILEDELEKQATGVEQKVIKWRRDIHQHPELGNREFRTTKLVAEHLRNLVLKYRKKLLIQA